MHQTFYIDIDEEISSIVDRLNKSMSKENYFVVPRRALFFQSIVNLKILKREAEKFGKKVVIISQDEIGLAMAERAEIESRDSLDGLDSPVSKSEAMPEEIEEDFQDEPGEENELEKARIISNQDKQARLSSIGTGDFFSDSHEEKSLVSRKNVHAVNSRTQAKKTVSLKNSRITRPQKIVLKKTPGTKAVSQNHLQHPVAAKTHAKTSLGENPLHNFDNSKAKSLEKMFGADHKKFAAKKPQPQTLEKEIGNGKLKKIFFGFMLFVFLVLIGAAAYVFIPSAKISIVPNITLQKVNLDIVAGTVTAKANQTNIPLRTFSQDQQVSQTYQVSGAPVVSGKKAHGTVTINNSFSSDPQTLVATTRLQTSDGKIFRINKNVVVPGYTTSAGQIKPGSVQAEITADQAGSDYNVDAGTTFTVPGFAGGPKFDKFSATANLAFVGGSIDGQTSTGGGAVSQNDLDKAKLQAETNFKNQIADLVKGQLAPDEVALAEAQKVTITHSASTAKVGTVTNSFDWVVTGNVTALIFSEKDVKNILLASSGKQGADVKNEITKIDYGSANPDFDNSTLNFKVYGEITTIPVINGDQVKNELLGKRDDQLTDILRKYSSIKNANVEFSPSFITRIPLYSSRVTIEIKNEAQ